MNIHVERDGTDSVRLFADDRIYYTVRRNPPETRWRVMRHYRNVLASGAEIGDYPTADEAITASKIC